MSEMQEPRSGLPSRTSFSVELSGTPSGMKAIRKSETMSIISNKVHINIDCTALTTSVQCGKKNNTTAMQ